MNLAMNFENSLSKRVDKAARLIRASPSRIYQAFADAGDMERWLPPEGMNGRMHTFDFREGGLYRMRLTYEEPTQAAGKTAEDADEVEVRLTRLVPNERIEQAVTFESEDPAFAGEMHMIWTFESVEEGTMVSIRCEDVPGGIRVEDHELGMNSTLCNLASFVEGNPS